MNENTRHDGALTIGDVLPDFELPACVSIDKAYAENFKRITSADIKGKWSVLFFWPFDFTFVCPTEIVDFNNHIEDFEDRDTVLLGASADSEHVHLAWRKTHPDLKDLKFPMLADYNKQLTHALGIAHRETGAPTRTTVIADPEGIIRHVSSTDLNVGRNAREIVRVLDGLQSGELCPACWEKGEETLTIS